jgi:hypothetical protein
VYPDGARVKDPNEFGRTVLLTAIVSGHVWHGGVKELTQAFPAEAIISPDPVTKLIPFQLSEDTTTSFRLLKAHPCVIEALIKSFRIWDAPDQRLETSSINNNDTLINKLERNKENSTPNVSMHVEKRLPVVLSLRIVQIENRQNTSVIR